MRKMDRFYTDTVPEMVLVNLFDETLALQDILLSVWMKAYYLHDV